MRGARAPSAAAAEPCGSGGSPDDRVPAERQRLDFYHAVQHLAAVGHALHSDDRQKLQVWLQPLVRQLKNESA